MEGRIVGWVERSETHRQPRSAAGGTMGFALLYPSYGVRDGEKSEAVSISPALLRRPPMKAMPAMTKEKNHARDGIREGDRGQRARPAACSRDDGDVRGDGEVQRGAGECRRDDRWRRAQAFIRGQADRLRRREAD